MQIGAAGEGYFIGSNSIHIAFPYFQETLTNVSLHSHATEIKVSLVSNRDWVLLEIMDNGKGITDRQISNPKSLGIQGMRERALFLGGELNIGGIKGKGTTVSIRVPLDISGDS